MLLPLNILLQTVCAQSCSDANQSQPSRGRSIFPMYTLPSSNSSKTTTTTTTTTTTSSALLLEGSPAPALEGEDHGQNNTTNSTPGEQEDGGILDQCGTLPIPGYGETRLFPFLLICVGAVLALAGLGVAVCINFVCAAEVEEEVDQVWHLPEGHGSSVLSCVNAMCQQRWSSHFCFCFHTFVDFKYEFDGMCEL